MMLVGCDRIHKEVAARRTGATTPRERIPERRTKATVCSWWDMTAYIKGSSSAHAEQGRVLIYWRSQGKKKKGCRCRAERLE
jgi:hypothetical protein